MAMPPILKRYLIATGSFLLLSTIGLQLAARLMQVEFGANWLLLNNILLLASGVPAALLRDKPQAFVGAIAGALGFRMLAVGATAAGALILDQANPKVWAIAFFMCYITYQSAELPTLLAKATPKEQ
jgi:hypothetical protein